MNLYKRFIFNPCDKFKNFFIFFLITYVNYQIKRLLAILA